MKGVVLTIGPRQASDGFDFDCAQWTGYHKPAEAEFFSTYGFATDNYQTSRLVCY